MVCPHYQKPSEEGAEFDQGSIPREVSTRKPLRISGLIICGGEGTTIEHLVALMDFLKRVNPLKTNDLTNHYP
jgi:glutamine amidotransferase PdxT